MFYIKRSMQFLAGLCFFAMLSLLAVLAFLGRQRPDRVTLPVPTGPYPVGRESFDWLDQNRLDPFALSPGIRRELTGWIWYPAIHGTERTAEYLPLSIRQAMAKQGHPLVRMILGPVRWLLTTDHANVVSHALDRPALAAVSAKLPLLLFKPGRGGTVLQYSVIAEDLASHGYLVVGSDSPYTTPAVVHEDGRIIFRTAAGAPSESARGLTSALAPGQPNALAIPVVEAWAADNSFLLDRLATAPKFAGNIDLTAVGAFGHSLGGAAALQFCRDDPRCKSGINMDGALWGDVVRTGLHKPFLFLFSDRPIFQPAAQPVQSNPLLEALARIRRDLPNDSNQLILRGSRHYNFADTALFTEPRAARFLGTIGPIDPQRALVVTMSCVRAFFDTHLKHQPAAYLQNRYPEIRIE